MFDEFNYDDDNYLHIILIKINEIVFLLIIIN